MKFMLNPEIIRMILSISLSLLTLFTFFQSRMTLTEKRLTILEENNKQQDKRLAENKSILDNHDQQMKVLIQMTEQIKNLSEKIEKIDNKLEEVK
ncbi:holin [Streptococcus phage CHPC1282]|uniref:Holin n=9 Tax=Vansinderenvirus TaxID=3044850 RepID=A0A7R6NH84_9CAUD|nr:holin [Streptococcus phage CHPC1282]AZS06214.1 holin [Streptococcus phage CHPC1282]